MAEATDPGLDDILSSALDDFEGEEGDFSSLGPAVTEGQAPGSDLSAAAAAAAAVAGGVGPDEEMRQTMAKLMADMQNPEFQRILEGSLAEVGGDAAAAAGGFAGESGAGAEADASIASTMEMLAKLSVDQGVDPAATEEIGEEVMKKMMDEFGSMAQKEDFQEVIDGMMRQLLAKDIMYTPMKQICDKYPEWLAENQSKLSTEDYERYGTQYQYFQRLVAVYETEPDNFPRLMELMQEMQETGQPPQEIIKELAPALEFGPDGMPVMPNMGPGVAGMPAIPGMGAGQCSIM